MYQFYYAVNNTEQPVHYKKKLSDVFLVTAIRPSMWEEHCLECSAPLCYHSCPLFLPRVDGRCKRFDNGLHISDHPDGCCKQSIRVKFRKWSNLLTIIYPRMLDIPSMEHMTSRNQKLGHLFEKILNCSLPINAKWGIIRTLEYIRRRKLRLKTRSVEPPDAFVFHGFSFEVSPFNLIVEIYNKHTPVSKYSILLQPGENLVILDKSRLDSTCATSDYIVKVYPENNIEAELDILWCEFVKGKSIEKAVPASFVKCVVWDLDQTLWNGILIETDNTTDLHLRTGVREIIHALDERGILQSIASKNDYTAAWDVVNRLHLDKYFLYPQIHWNAKSVSMEEIARNLNIGIDSLALIDDSPFERAQVQAEWPQVRVYDPADLPLLLDKPEFHAIVTEESRQRRMMYQAEEKRKSLQQNEGNDLTSFLQKCHLKIEIFTPQTDEELLRCYELVVRTNQLNMSGMKYTHDEFDIVLTRPSHHNFAFSCQDDFGKYGIVGFGQYQQEDKSLVFSEFAMSCRVARKHVESALFSSILKYTNTEQGVFCVQKTHKNTLLRNSLEEIGFVIASEDDAEVTYHFSTNLLHSDVVSAVIRQSGNK